MQSFQGFNSNLMSFFFLHLVCILSHPACNDLKRLKIKSIHSNTVENKTNITAIVAKPREGIRKLVLHTSI